MTCDYPGCGRKVDLVRIPVGPDRSRLAADDDGEPYFDVRLEDKPPTYVTGTACKEHIYVVRRRLMEQHQPRHVASREGRP